MVVFGVLFTADSCCLWDHQYDRSIISHTGGGSPQRQDLKYDLQVTDAIFSASLLNNLLSFIRI